MAVFVGLDGIFPSNSIFTFWTQVFEKNGTFRYQFGIPGKEEGQLWYPRKVSTLHLYFSNYRVVYLTAPPLKSLSVKLVRKIPTKA